MEEGANLEIATPRNPLLAEKGLIFPRGTRALHAAAYAGELSVLRALLQSGAQPNAKDGYGCIPLMAACNGRRPATENCVTLVEVLLEAGALPSLADNEGRVALHTAAHWGADDAIEVLVAAAPSTLKYADHDGLTPLSVATAENNESTMRLLLSVGASDKETWMKHGECSLGLAAEMGHEGVMNLLLDTGLEAVGGVEAARAAMKRAVKFNRTKILEKLLGIEGEEMRAWWANSDSPEGLPVLLATAAGCCLAATSVLLAAGADELVFENNGLLASGVIGAVLDEGEKDEAKVAAFCRMLERGPAFRARSYCWPVQTSTALVSISSGGVAKRNAPLDLRIFRPSNHAFFTTRFVR